MGFRFRRTYRTGFGRLNQSKSGASFSIGGSRKGPVSSTLNLSKRGVMQTVSLPGSGLSWRWRWGARPRRTRPVRQGPFSRLCALVLCALVAWTLYAAIFTPGSIPPSHRTPANQVE